MLWVVTGPVFDQLIERLTSGVEIVEARNGEGVMGLRRGFAQAEAQNLVMMLWPISDKWSAEIMQAFCEKAMATGDAPQAMAEVQAEWLAKLRKEKGGLMAARIAGPFVLTTPRYQSPQIVISEGSPLPPHI